MITTHVICQLSCSAYYPNIKCPEARALYEKHTNTEPNSASIMRMIGGKKSADREMLLDPVWIMREAQDELHRKSILELGEAGDVVSKDDLEELVNDIAEHEARYWASVDVVERLLTDEREAFLEREAKRHGSAFNEENYPKSTKKLYSWEWNVHSITDDHPLEQLFDEIHFDGEET